MSDERRREFVNSVRGTLIVAKALAYAIATIDALPPDKQEASDRDDMVHILTGTKAFGQFKDVAVRSVEYYLGRKPDLTDHKTTSEFTVVRGGR